MYNLEECKNKLKRVRFTMLRREIIGESCKEVYDKVSEYNKMKSIVELMESRYSKEELVSSDIYRNAMLYLDYTQNPSIRKRLLDDLEWAGFNKEDAGTKHIATLATIFFHERKLYGRKDINDIINKSYWDLSNYNNEHYGMLGLPKEQVVADILKVINANNNIDCSHEKIVYELADRLKSFDYKQGEEKRKPYSFMINGKTYSDMSDEKKYLLK